MRDSEDNDVLKKIGFLSPVDMHGACPSRVNLITDEEAKAWKEGKWTESGKPKEQGRSDAGKGEAVAASGAGSNSITYASQPDDDSEHLAEYKTLREREVNQVWLECAGRSRHISDVVAGDSVASLADCLRRAMESPSFKHFCKFLV